MITHLAHSLINNILLYLLFIKRILFNLKKYNVILFVKDIIQITFLHKLKYFNLKYTYKIYNLKTMY